MADDRRLREEIRTLGELLGGTLREQAGDGAFELVERVRGLAKGRRGGDEGAERALLDVIAGRELDELADLIHSLSIFFDLANLAEDRHRVRVLRERDRRGLPRRESFAELAGALRAGGAAPGAVQELLDEVAIELVFTAHPTEAKRRSVREKVRDLRGHLYELDQRGLLERERAELTRRIRADLTGLWQTDFVRFRRPSVLEELDRSLFFAGNLWHVTPRLYGGLREALAGACPGHEFDLQALLRFGTWIGGDRDGNPNVTAEVTRAALRTLRREAISRHMRNARLAQRNLSVSATKAGASEELSAAIEDAVRDEPRLRDAISHLSESEPYRRWLEIMRWRLERAGEADLSSPAPPGAYTGGGQLVDDLALMRRSLCAHRGELIAESYLDDWICQAKVFGLHLMRLDVRQESTWYHDVLAELLARLGVCGNYADLDEQQRQSVLTGTAQSAAEMDAEGLSENAREAVELFSLLARVAAVSGPESLGVHVISMTHRASDVLAVLWLSRWAAARQGLPDDRLPMPVAPLFETIDDLHSAAETVEAMLSHEQYAAHVRALGGKQVVMIGYSDSTKDGGYVAACWGLHEAQIAVHRAAADKGVRVVFFHGRGGSLGRGGGPAARAIRSHPPRTVRAGLRVTEQGEVLAERYDDPEIAYRHLEQVVSATLAQAWIASPDARAGKAGVENGELDAVLSKMAAESRRVYRELVDHPGFIRYFEEATPIGQIEQLPIGSRPSRRRAERSLSTLRAIPWVFSWTQCRHLIPAWYGLGSAVEHCGGRNPGARSAMKRWYEESMFFRGMIDNAALALAKADLGIAYHHAQLSRDESVRQEIWSMIEREYERSRRAVLDITGRRRLLGDTPWLKRSIEVRNPYVDPLNLIQVELFRRLREMGEDSPESGRVESLIRLTIQGIAGGLRTTG